MERSNFKDRIPNEVVRWFLENDMGEVTSIKPVSGGCINNAVSVSTTSGRDFFLKTNKNVPKDMFACEADGLNLLSVEGGPRIPHVYLFAENFLLLENLSPGPINENCWEIFGNQLARLHQTVSPKFGLDKDNYIGSSPQVNPWIADGFEFYANHRLIYQADMAARNSLLTVSETKLVTKIAEKLKELLPKQVAVLIHGDLWSGNVICGPNGEPSMIDPAVYYGWAEADLAMTVLFGGFPKKFYDSYENSANLATGWRDRLEIYNLYHLLNHLNIFGMSYHGRLMSTLNKYS